nr:unnamed protein product [Callosobruchus analis]
MLCYYSISSDWLTHIYQRDGSNGKYLNSPKKALEPNSTLRYYTKFVSLFRRLG